MSTFAFSNRAPSATGAALALRAVAPDDAADLPDGPTRAVFVGVAGTLAVMDEGGVVATLISADSQYHPIQARRVLATGTTAGGIVALY